MPKFQVDTHLFRELGELLVGRDSTALVELIKNAYDADARKVTVSGKALTKTKGTISIVDDGVGMTKEEFEKGFLTIASRSKELGDKRSRKFKRRYTGMKGIGRLAAHKLARVLKLESTSGGSSIAAKIDWDKVESSQTIDSISDDAIEVRDDKSSHGPGTTIRLSELRRGWTNKEIARFVSEAASFEPAELLYEKLPASVIEEDLLFDVARVRDSRSSDPGFSVQLEGDFDAGEAFWKSIANVASWVIEIKTQTKDGRVWIKYGISPTKRTQTELPHARVRHFKEEHPDPSNGPLFQCRILVREGQLSDTSVRDWAKHAAGIRVFMEGFRVLPYGEAKDDWLGIDFDYSRRSRKLLAENGETSSDDADAGLTFLSGASYFGAVFLTEEGAPNLKMLVNREGFISGKCFEDLVSSVRRGVDLFIRVRAAATKQQRQARREGKKKDRPEQKHEDENLHQLREALTKTAELAKDATTALERNNTSRLRKNLGDLKTNIQIAERSLHGHHSDQAMLRVLASVGTQMAAFVHEVRALLAMAESLEAEANELQADLSSSASRKFSRFQASLGDLRRNLERNASYLTDVISLDARRRRTRQDVKTLFDAVCGFLDRPIRDQQLTIENRLPKDLESRPMFKAEMTALLTNIISNAIKAAGDKGRIRAEGEIDGNKHLRLVIQNSGAEVNLRKSELHFRPFESTTVKVDPLLGQGMGMGLPITRRIVEEYGGTIHFIQPRSSKFKSAIEIVLPDQ